MGTCAQIDKKQAHQTTVSKENSSMNIHQQLVKKGSPSPTRDSNQSDSKKVKKTRKSGDLSLISFLGCMKKVASYETATTYMAPIPQTKDRDESKTLYTRNQNDGKQPSNDNIRFWKGS